MSLRMQKVNSELRRQLMEIIQQEVDDPNVGVLSITRVDTTNDLREAKVYFSLLDETQIARVQNILDKMNKFLRVSLGKRTHLKILPELRFIPDDTIRYSVDIYTRIEEIKKEEETRNNEHQENHQEDKQQ
ncbi:MAG: 30S ribosome-binding factor RbfA [Candidatus Omnitrophota bacterium]|nr:30S ribosome-binding factor RbfA [Candidatus Omnitrophota bacterium]